MQVWSDRRPMAPIWQVYLVACELPSECRSSYVERAPKQPELVRIVKEVIEDAE